MLKHLLVAFLFPRQPARDLFIHSNFRGFSVENGFLVFERPSGSAALRMMSEDSSSFYGAAGSNQRADCSNKQER